MEFNSDDEYQRFVNLLAFLCIVTSSSGNPVENDHLMNASPDYIVEKFNQFLPGIYNSISTTINWAWGMDGNNRARMFQYLKRWVFKN